MKQLGRPLMKMRIGGLEMKRIRNQEKRKIEGEVVEQERFGRSPERVCAEKK